MRKLREEMMRTQDECAAAAGMDQRRWQDIESGRYENVSLATLTAIGRALGVESYDEFLPPLAVAVKPPAVKAGQKAKAAGKAGAK